MTYKLLNVPSLMDNGMWDVQLTDLLSDGQFRLSLYMDSMIDNYAYGKVREEGAAENYWNNIIVVRNEKTITQQIADGEYEDMTIIVPIDEWMKGDYLTEFARIK